ncbi:hypothetical protein ACH42_03040 [Endozoicomonas sp. (ex Bugula neritina AB1)]|nr:hypothetical protein ACH42_03040 [Endozoicomonas sp. (ex Bugula neritina AB1)]
MKKKEEKKNIRLSKKALTYVATWFLLGVFFGSILSLQNQIEPFTKSMLYGFSIYLENYNEFAWSVAFYLISFPVFFIMIKPEVEVENKITKEQRLIFFALIPCFLLMGAGFITPDVNGMFSKLIKNIILYGGWIGASFCFFISYYLTAVFLAIGLNKNK